MWRNLRKIARGIAPLGLVEIYRASKASRRALSYQEWRKEFHADRQRRIYGAIQEIKNIDRGDAVGMSFGDIVGFLIRRGLPRQHVIEGSIPEESLAFICNFLDQELSSEHPLRALHVGNFVGVSLAYLTSYLVSRDPQSLMVSIDPNLPHRGIENPQQHAAAVLGACGVLKNSLIVAGYSGIKSISNDGVVFDGYDPCEQIKNEAACENCLQSLASICPRSFDLAFIDGNHEAQYLIAELENVKPLLKPGAIVVLDDVNAEWEEIHGVFQNIDLSGMTPLCTDGRVGIASYIHKLDAVCPNS